MVTWDGLRSPGPPQGTPGSLASFRRTRRQGLGRGLVVGVLVGAIVVGLFGPLLWILGWTGEEPITALVIKGFATMAVTGVGGAIAGPVLATQVGVDADDAGLHGTGVPGSSAAQLFGPWPAIDDMRAERRGRRTVVVVRLRSGAWLELPTPTDGPLLAADPAFEQKLFQLRNLWETYRRGLSDHP